MSKPVANLRLFVAIYPPIDVARSLLELLKSRPLPDLKISAVEQVHMTLQFIGDTPVRELDVVIESVTRATAGLSAFCLRLRALIALPERGPARLIAAETNSPPALLEMHRRLVTRLARQPRELQRERFRPHLTLCRFRPPARIQIDSPISLPEFSVDRVRLMRSTLATTGAQHHEVVACELETS